MSNIIKNIIIFSFLILNVYRFLFYNLQNKTIGVIGGGVSGLIAACEMKKLGYNVKIFEKNEHIGGRIQQIKYDNFTFDMGPSWYWMPEIYEKIYNRYDFKRNYSLLRLDPAYRIIYHNDSIDIPGTPEKFIK